MSGRQTKAEIVAQREQVRMLGIVLGNWREAARQCGLAEGRVLNWVVRYGWKLPKRIQAPHPRELLSPVVGVVTPAESLEERPKHDAEATPVGLSTATQKASVSLAERHGDEVVYASARLKDVVSSAAQLHGWNQPAGVNVNIANIPMPTAEERAEMTAIDRKLDAIAAKLKIPLHTKLRPGSAGSLHAAPCRSRRRSYLPPMLGIPETAERNCSSS
jgi:hypothetical protein